MAMASQVIAGDGVQHAAAKEGGAYQDVDDIEHGGCPWSATTPPHAVSMLRCTTAKPDLV
jgi:hypothetical protein